MSMLKKILLIGICMLLLSCNQSTKELLDGTWAVGVLYYNGKSIFEEIVIVNGMSLSKTGNIRIPYLDEEMRKTKKDQIGTWSYNEDTGKLFLDTKSEYLKGYFDLCFKRDADRNLVLVLQSDELYLEATKFLSENHWLSRLPVSCEEDQAVTAVDQ